MKKLIGCIVSILFCAFLLSVRAEEKLDSVQLDLVPASNLSQQYEIGESSNDRTVTKEELIAIMNYCTYSLTTILEDQSMIVLEKEKFVLENNLKIKPTAKMDEKVKIYLKSMLEALQNLELTNEEHEVLQRVTSIKNDNRKWKAISSSLNNVLFLFPGKVSPQVIFQGLLTVARGAVEYAVMTNEASAEELMAMWNFKKKKLQTLNVLNSEAFDLIHSLFRKYYDLLDDDDRLTKDDMKAFVAIVNELDPEIRLNKFNASRNKKLKILPAYWYHKGMTYIDMMGQDGEDTNDYLNQAWHCFATYEDMIQKAPIFYRDKMFGCIALAYLGYRDDLTSEQKKYYAQAVVDNLPYSSAAIIQSSVAFRSSGDLKNAFIVVKDVLAEDKLDDRDALILYSASLTPFLSEEDVALMERLIHKMKGASANAIAGYYTLRSKRDSSRMDCLAERLKAIIHPKDNAEGLEIDQNLFYDFSQIELCKIEKNLDRKMRLYKGRLNWANCFEKEKLIKKFDFFKNDEKELYNFITKVYGAGDNAYVVKKNLNFNEVETGTGLAYAFKRYYYNRTAGGDEKKKKEAAKQCESLSELLGKLKGDSNDIVVEWDEATNLECDSLYLKKLEWGASYIRIDLKGEECPVTLLYVSQVEDPIFVGTSEDFKSLCNEKEDVPEPTPSTPWWKFWKKF